MIQEVCDVHFASQHDVVVVGLGTAGAIAAIEAAAQGASVLGIDRLNAMGGLGTLGCVWSYYCGTRGGRHEAVNARAHEMEKQGYVSAQRPDSGESLNGFIKSCVLEQMVCEAEGSLLYDTLVTGVYMEGERVVGLRCLSGGRQWAVGARVVIDATGESEVCLLAGCRLLPNRDMDGKKQIFSKPIPVLHDGLYIRGTWTYCGQIARDDAEALTQAHLHAAAMPFYLESLHVGRRIGESPLLGTREGRRIDSAENLLFTDMCRGHETGQPIFYAYSHVDNLCRDVALESAQQQDWHVIADLWAVGVTVGVPMGALIPKRVDGLLAAGKCMGVDHDLAGCLRMKRDMEKSGEAAAQLACLAISRAIEPRDVPYEALAARLTVSGCLNAAQRQDWRDFRKPMDAPDGHIPRPFDIGEIRAGMASDAYGPALWTLRNMDRQAALPLLREWMASGERALARHSALAAGMLGDPLALKLLRTMAREIEQTPRKPGLKYNYPDACRAICLLGRLEDAASVDWLLRIVEERALFDALTVQPDGFIQTPEDYYFQFFSHALIALLAIARVHSPLRARIFDRLATRVCAPDFSLFLTQQRIDMTDALRGLFIEIKKTG